MTENRTSSTSEAVGTNVKPEPIQYWSTTERGRKAEDRLVEFPYDTEAWGVLVREAQLYPMEAARVMYERIVKQFPTAGRYWKTYIEQEVIRKYKGSTPEKWTECCMLRNDLKGH